MSTSRDDFWFSFMGWYVSLFVVIKNDFTWFCKHLQQHPVYAEYELLQSGRRLPPLQISDCTDIFCTYFYN